MASKRFVRLTHAWRDDKRVEYHGDAEPGYSWITDEHGRRRVPNDTLKPDDGAEEFL